MWDTIVYPASSASIIILLLVGHGTPPVGRRTERGVGKKEELTGNDYGVKVRDESVERLFSLGFAPPFSLTYSFNLIHPLLFIISSSNLRSIFYKIPPILYQDG